jgi:hypothetical protein
MRTINAAVNPELHKVPSETGRNPQSDADQLDAAADQAIAACGGDAREAVKALLVANAFVEAEIEASVSRGYLRGVRHGKVQYVFGLKEAKRPKLPTSSHTLSEDLSAL